MKTFKEFCEGFELKPTTMRQQFGREGGKHNGNNNISRVAILHKKEGSYTPEDHAYNKDLITVGQGKAKEPYVGKYQKKSIEKSIKRHTLKSLKTKS
jgi:hypothetical protein